MANYCTTFSCDLNVCTAQNAERAYNMYRNPPEGDLPDIPFPNAFHLEIHSENGDAQLFMYADGNGDVEVLIQFVKLCAAEFKLTGRWGFEYAYTCSSLRLDGFGGGAHVLDLGTGETVAWTDTRSWLTAALDGADPYA